MSNHITHTVILEEPCSEGPTCPKQIAVDQDTENTYFVFKTDIDPAIAEALAHHVGPGERLGYVPNHIAGR